MRSARLIEAALALGTAGALVACESNAPHRGQPHGLNQPTRLDVPQPPSASLQITSTTRALFGHSEVILTALFKALQGNVELVAAKWSGVIDASAARSAVLEFDWDIWTQDESGFSIRSNTRIAPARVIVGMLDTYRVWQLCGHDFEDHEHVAAYASQWPKVAFFTPTPNNKGEGHIQLHRLHGAWSFLLAHELAHIAFGDPGQVIGGGRAGEVVDGLLPEQREERADAFAIQLLAVTSKEKFSRELDDVAVFLITWAEIEMHAGIDPSSHPMTGRRALVALTALGDILQRVLGASGTDTEIAQLAGGLEARRSELAARIGAAASASLGFVIPELSPPPASGCDPSPPELAGENLLGCQMLAWFSDSIPPEISDVELPDIIRPIFAGHWIAEDGWMNAEAESCVIHRADEWGLWHTECTVVQAPTGELVLTVVEQEFAVPNPEAAATRQPLPSGTVWRLRFVESQLAFEQDDGTLWYWVSDEDYQSDDCDFMRRPCSELHVK